MINELSEEFDVDHSGVPALMTMAQKIGKIMKDQQKLTVSYMTMIWRKMGSSVVRFRT